MKFNPGFALLTHFQTTGIWRPHRVRYRNGTDKHLGDASSISRSQLVLLNRVNLKHMQYKYRHIKGFPNYNRSFVVYNTGIRLLLSTSVWVLLSLR